jgi:hypothetical protein
VLGKIQVRSLDQQLKINKKWLNLARGKKPCSFLLGCVINSSIMDAIYYLSMMGIIHLGQ